MDKARVAALEARKAPDLDEATKAVEWHMGNPQRELATDVRNFVDNYKNNGVPVRPPSVLTVMHWYRLARQP